MDKSNVCKIALVALIIGCSAPAGAETVLKMGMAAPEKTPWVSNARSTAKSISEGTKGSITINIFPGSQLGNEQDVIRQVSRGRIEMGSFSNTAASLMVPEIALLAAPYLWENRKQADCALDKYMIPVFKEKFDKKDLVILGWSEVGYMGFASKKPILNFQDIAGRKIRVAPTKASSITTTSFGANSVVLPITEVASALQTGLVDGADLPGLAFTALGIGKVAGNWIATNHSHQVGVVVMSKKSWKKLTTEEQSQIVAAQSSVDTLRKQVRGAEKFTLGKFKEAGGNIVIPGADDLNKWQAQAKKARTQLIKEIGGDAIAIFKKIEEAKNACAA